MARPATLIDLISAALAQPRERVLEERPPGGEWRSLSARTLRERIDAVARALADAGARRGERIGIFSDNRIDWLVCDYAILFAGAVTVPMFATLPDEHVALIVRDARLRLVFTETPARAHRVRTACAADGSHGAQCNDLRIVTFEPGSDSLIDFEARGRALLASDGVSGQADDVLGPGVIGPDDLAVQSYTSGTAGEPKGVMLTHGNVTSNVVDAFETVRGAVAEGDVALSVLPFAHIFEHTTALGFLHFRLRHVVSRPERLLVDMRDAKPHLAAFVPRIFEHVLRGIIARARTAGGSRAMLVPWALAVGREHARAPAEGRRAPLLLRLRYALARALVLRKLRAALGLERVVLLVSGSAALHREVALTFAGAGIVVCEGYGLTEASPVVAVNRVATVRYGTVGPPIPGVEVQIAQDGEILVRGPNVMLGYSDPTDESPVQDGWLHTGDLGRLDADGYLSILDRKRDVFKIASGEWVSPARIESALRHSPYVGQAVVVGAHRSQAVALIAPDWDFVRREFALEASAAPGEIAANAAVRARIGAEAARATATLAPQERIRRVALLPRDLTIEDGELSPTLKVKRRAVTARYAPLIDAAYASSTAGETAP